MCRNPFALYKELSRDVTIAISNIQVNMTENPLV